MPDGDLFDALASGNASIATDEIETFTEKGLEARLRRGARRGHRHHRDRPEPAAVGGVEFAVDGEDVDLSKTVGYKGMMFSGVPNVAISLGYTNASWTLKCDLICEYVCRLLNHMDEHGYDHCTPRRPDASVEIEPFIDLMSGYVLRSIDKFPKQGEGRRGGCTRTTLATS